MGQNGKIGREGGKEMSVICVLGIAGQKTVSSNCLFRDDVFSIQS